MKAWVIARPINGIALNGDEYICGEDGRYLIWETEAEALAAMWKMFNWVDIHNHGIYVKQIELEDEPCNEIENPCYHCYMGAIGECIRCKYSENEWHGDLDAFKIEISDNDKNTNRENTYPWEV